MMEDLIHNKKQHITIAIMLTLLLTGGTTAWASENPSDNIKSEASVQKKEKKTPIDPVKITGNYLKYGYVNGSVLAKGDVVVIDGPQTIKTNLFFGNNNNQMYYAPDKLSYVSPDMDINGNDLVYNGKLKEGLIAKGEGFFSGKYYVRGRDITVSTDPEKQKGTIEKGMITTRHAMAWKNSPDYRIEGQDISVVPNQYINIKEAKFYIRHWHIATFKSYTTKIGEAGKKQGSSLFSLIPRPHYDTDSGFGLRAGVYRPIGENGLAFFKYGWYSKSGFKPDIGYRHALPWGAATVAYSKDRNDNHDYWVTKAPELRIATNSFPIMSNKLTLSGLFTIGDWKEGDVRGVHHKERAELNYGPIPFGKKLNTYATVGYERDYYAYNKTLRNNFYWNVRSHYQLFPTVSTYVGYYDNKHRNDSPYRFDSIDDDNYLLYGAWWTVDRMNTLGVGYKYSFNRNEVTEQKIYYNRDLHSMLARFSYDVKDHDFTFKIDFKDLDFTI